MQILTDLIKILIPALAVLYGMYLTAQMFLQKQFKQKQIEVKQKNAEIITPIRLQAYERMTLFLERISPNNLLIRLNSSNLYAIAYQQILLQDIREEFNHNLSQQVYMSEDAWEKTRQAMNEVVTLINTSAAEISPDAPAIELSKKILERLIVENQKPTAEATRFLKEEIQKSFM